MDNQNFREWAHRLADWMADYFEAIEDYPVKPDLKPGVIKDQLPAEPPLGPEKFEKIFEDFERQIMPGMTHWQHPQFFAYFPASRSAPSVLAEMMTAAIGAQCMTWYTSPAAEELEERMMEWLREMLGLPEFFRGVIQDTASTATLVALLMARERRSGGRIKRRGWYDQPVQRVYASEHIHSSVQKAMRIAGFGEDHLVLIDTDDNYAILPEALERAVRRDRERGYEPTAVAAAMGTTSSTALDPIRPLGEVCQRYDLFFHVDAAYGGAALLLPEMRWMAEGMELADSLVFNPHKWMFVNFDCSAFFVRDPELLTDTFSIYPEYLKTPEDRQVNNYRDWGIQLGRRFRALKLWFVIRNYGVEGLRERIRLHLRLGQWLAEAIKASNDFELLAPTPLNLVCFRYHPPGSWTEAQLNRLNERLLHQLNASGKILLTHTKLNGRYTLRFVAGQTETCFQHVEKGWRFIRQVAEAMEARPSDAPDQLE